MNGIVEYLGCDTYKYYNGYWLDDKESYELTASETAILENASMLVDNHWSLRELGRNCCRSKSQLQRDFKISLRRLSYELYGCVRRTLKENKERYFR